MEDARLTHVDLFSGIGGIALAARWAGFDTRLFCEIDPFACKVLRKHWPEVPIHGDVRTLDKKTLGAHGINRPTLLTGGFPCQPFSTAGKRKGKDDDRHLWPAMLRVVRECRPTWVVGENVAGFVRMALDDVFADLEGQGYACRAFLVPAAGVGASHYRERCFTVAHVADAEESRRGLLPLPTFDLPRSRGRREANAPESGGEAHGRRWLPEPRLGRVVNGVSSELEQRLRGLGNAVVPQQIYPILAGIAAAQREAVPA